MIDSMIQHRWQAVFVVGVALAAILASGSLLVSAQDGEWPQIAFVEVMRGLDQPVYITHAGDGSGRLFVVEQPGRIRIIEDGALLERPFLDIAARVQTSYEEGLLSAAFPPGYASKGYFYVYYTNLAGDNVVARFRTSASDPNVADEGSEETVLYLHHPTFRNHNGGQLAFSPTDGYLWISTGDGGNAGDNLSNAQNPGSLLGKLLRIDVESGRALAPSQCSGSFAYRTPRSNPYTAVPRACPEIMALGLRNPWRFSFDRLTGNLFLGDVGQRNREEIDYLPEGSGGTNYGWPILEGNACYNPPSDCEPPDDYEAPIRDYGRDEGTTVTGGFVYRGTTYPRMQGVYFYGDYGSGRIWGLRRVGGGWHNQLLFETGWAISTFGEDEAGNLYLADVRENAIYQITDPAVVVTPTPTATIVVITPTPTPTIVVGTPTPTPTPVGPWWLYLPISEWRGNDP